MPDITLSIVIPVYKVEAYISECVQSIISQEWDKRTELIFIDDCGGDKSMEIALATMQQAPSHFSYQVLRHEHNRGLSAARNTGIAAASGEYLFLMDSDDSLLPGALRALWHTAEQSGADMVVGGVQTTIPDRYGTYFVFPAEKLVSPKHYASYLLRGSMFVTAWNRLLRRSWYVALGIEFAEGLLHEDDLWSLLVALKYPKTYLLNQPTYLYRVNREGSIMETISWQIPLSLYRIYQLGREAIKASEVDSQDAEVWSRTTANRCALGLFHGYRKGYAESSAYTGALMFVRLHAIPFSDTGVCGRILSFCLRLPWWLGRVYVSTAFLWILHVKPLCKSILRKWHRLISDKDKSHRLHL